MRKSAASDDEVARLKNLLFDEEQRALDQVRKLVGDHHARIGTDRRFQHSVSEIIANALRDAEVTHHRDLAAAISPVVVAGIRREIANSRDEMVDALYPILGRLVSAYVSSTVREFMDEANAQLESRLSARRLRLRIKSLLTGRPYGELLLANTSRFELQEMLLIRRGSGILLDHWQAEPSADEDAETGSDSLVSGLLTAITDFAEEAFDDDVTQLRTLDIGRGRIHLRATPAYLLALICGGPETGRFRKRLDKELFGVLEEYADVVGDPDAAEDKPRLRAILPTLAERLTTIVEAEKRPPVLAVGILALIGVSVAGAIGWSIWKDAQVANIRADVERVIAQQPGLKGYPLTVDVAPDRTKVSVTGLAPSPAAGAKLAGAAGQAISPIPLETHLAYVPSTESLQRALAELTDLAGKLRALEPALAATASAKGLAEVSDKVEALSGRLAGVESKLLQSPSSSTVEKLAATVQDLSKRLDDPRRVLRQWTRTNAVFFGEGAEFRSPAEAKTRLEALSRLVMATDASLRVIGYTDGTGGVGQNRRLATARADRVADELVALGVPRARVIVIGRSRGPYLSDKKGPGSGNRRVEFEIAFRGEQVAPETGR